MPGHTDEKYDQSGSCVKGFGLGRRLGSEYKIHIRKRSELNASKN